MNPVEPTTVVQLITGYYLWAFPAVMAVLCLLSLIPGLRNQSRTTMPREIQYRRVGWKYVLDEAVELTLPNKLFGTSYISPHLVLVRGVAVHGIAPHLSIRAGYAWDGASGPTLDTKATIYPALVHDVLYQLIRLGILLPGSRKEADKFFRRLLKEGGMTFFRRWYFYRAVRWFGASSARPE